MLNITLEDSRARALDFADMTGSGFPDTARLDGYLNDGFGEIHELLALHDYLRSKHAITLVAGTEEYALPADFYKASSVWKLVSGRRYEIKRFNIAQLSGMKTTGPASSDSAELWYVPQRALLVKPDDKIGYDLPNGWETFAPLHAAIQLLNREESDVQALMAERERIKQRIVLHVEPRDASPDSIEDHYGRWADGSAVEDAVSLRYRVIGSKILFVDFGSGA